MATKLQHYTQLADQTAVQITSSYQNWTAFLQTMARLYKYPYHEQLMIFAQRPNATACADYDTWNKQMRRYVRGKNTGIALIDTSGDNPELKYVFDVSDTRGGKNARYPYLFQFREEHEMAVTHALIDRFEVDGARTLPDLIEEIVNWTTADYWDAHGQDILRIVDGSFLEEYDEENIRFIFHQAAVVSTTYTILSRCGMNPELRYEHLDFMPVFDFNTPQTISALGSAISQTSETVLRQIEVTVKRYEREKHTERSQNYERPDLQTERGLLHPQPEPVRPEPAAADQVREDAENLLEGTPPDPVEQHDPVGDSVPPSAGDRPDSEPAAGTDLDGAEEVGGSDGGTESQRPDEMGGADEHLESTGGGDHSGGTDLRLTDDEPPTSGEQFSFFASEAEQIQYIAEAESADLAPSAFTIPQEYIDQMLRVGSNTDNARTKLAIEYSKQLPKEQLLSFIQKTYHGGYGLKFGDTKVCAWYTEDGMQITYGDSARYARNAQILSWDDVASRIGELLEEGQFATNVELAEMRSFEQKELAEKLIYLTRDIDREYTDNKYMRIIHDLRGGFPSETEQIKVFLSEPESYGAIMDQLYDLRDAYAQDREIMRFRASNPNNLVPLMEQYAFPRKAYTSDMTAIPEEHPFITEDEIEDALSGGSHYEYTKLRIYDFFHTPHTPKEKLDFLKKEYGTGGGNVALSRNFHSHENYDSRGIRYDKPGCTRIELPWKKVVKYYDSLMESGHFISPDELAKLREKKIKKEAELQAAKEAEARQEELNKNTAQAINDIKHDHPEDIVLYQVGDFFEIYGDDANTAAPILGLHLSSRALAGAGRLNFCGIPTHKLEENLEKLRLHHPVTISAASEDGSRNVYSLSKLEPPAPVVEEAGHENVAQSIASVGPFWEAYREVKKEHPDYYALVKLNDGYFAFEKDAQAISKLLGLETVKREVIGRKRPVTVCFLPVADFQEHSTTISKTGAGMVLVDRVPGKELETFVVLSEKDAAKAKETQRDPVPAEITQDDIDNALVLWNGNNDSKLAVVSYMQEHGRERSTAEWLAKEYGTEPEKPLNITRTGTDATVSLTWPKVQRRIAQLIKEDRFLTEEDKQQSSLIGTVVEVNHTPYEVIRIDPTDDLGPMAVMRDLTSPEDDPMYSTEPLDYAMVLAGPQRELPKQEKPEPDSFEFRGYHFTAAGKLPKGYDINEISKVISSDRELGMSSYDWAKHTYSHYSFYLASGDSQADLFRCLENGKVYLPGDNELFCYTGEYQELEHTVPPAVQTTPPTVRAIYDQFYPVIRDAVLADVPYQNACKHTAIEHAHAEGNEAVRRAVLDNNEMQLVKLYFGSTKFHNRLHREIVDETYPVLAAENAYRYQVVVYHHFENGFDEKLEYRTIAEAEKIARSYVDGTHEDDGFRYDGAAVYDAHERKYIHILGDFPDSKAQQDISGISTAHQQEDSAISVPEMDSFAEFELPDRDPTAPPYAVGDTVYLEKTPFIITEIRDHEVQLQDPSLAYPIFRAEPKATFEYLLQQDYRNGAISEFLSADLDEVDPDLQDVLTAEGGLLDTRDKEIAARWFRNGESNTHIAMRLSDTFTSKDGVVELAGGSAEYCGTTLDLKVVIHGDSEARLSFKWDKIAPILRAMYQQERDGFTLEPIQKEPVTLEGVPSYQVGDSVVLPYPDRDIKGTIGYISENGIRIDTGPYSWSHEVLPHNQFEELLRQDERNAHLFTSEEKELPAQEATLEEELDRNPISIQVDGEWKTFPNAKAAEEAAYEEHKANVRRNAQNFHITDDDLGVGGAKAKFQANINAIKLLKALEAEGAQATPEQQEVLSRYVGWGGVPDAFDPNKANWSAEYQELKDLLTPEEYDAARASTLNAHYTSPTVIRAMYEALGNMGFKTGNILEPAMGVGNFFGMLPEEMKNSRLYGVELDSITGRIAQQLYPKAKITVAGFETTDRRDFFDLAIGNVPFGQYKVNDPAYNKLNFNIHNYFFAKALDQVRPGGVVAFVTSRYTLDAQNANVRKYLAQRADLLGAIRLPNTAFKANAGTEVVSDIIFLQKRDRPIEIEPEWIHLGQTEDGYAINSYFLEHPEMVMGKNSSESTAHGMDYTVEPLENVSLADQLHESVQHIQGSYQEAELPDIGEGEAIKETLPADPNVKNYSYTVVDGEVYFRENSIMVKPDLNATAKERIKGMIQLKNCVQNLIEVQMDENTSDSVIKQYQAELNEVYDSFVAKYGIINNRGNKLAYSDDSSYFLLCALEVMDDEGNFLRKADMFTTRTIQPHRVVTSVETASEALAISIAEKAEVDMEYMSQLCGKTVEEVASDLRGVIFKDPLYLSNPLDGWQTADEYLSGNVRKKLRQAEAAAVDDPAYMVNVEALRAAQPKDLDASEIEVRLGATWIDKSYIQQFMNETFDTPKRLLDTIQVQYSSYTAAWNITNKTKIFYDDVAAYSTYGTDRASAYDILEDSLNLRDVRIYDTVYDDEGKEKRVLNAKETTLASQKQSMIREAFKDWIWRDPDRRQAIVKQYNEEMNSIRPREYDGSHIVFAGMNPEITLREHQRNAIAHTLYGGNTLLAHEVGAGKTFEMVAAAMESKRLGLCQKSIFVVPNHLTEQWASEFLRLYPSANILVTKQRDFEKHNRKKFCARIATGDYDAVIIGHSQFERIPMSQQRQEWILQDQIADITMGIQEVQDNGGEKFTVKQLERTKRGLEGRLEKLRAGHRKDDVVTFEQLGVDRLFVDEAHNYKNLFLYTKMQNVAGLSTTDAQKSSDMFAKCRYMDEITGNRGVIFATGTPVSNSMTELYTMQRYLQYAKLDEMGMTHFDCWASRFGETVTALELAPEGKGYRPRTRFSRFFNLPELMNLFKETADIKTADQLNLPVPEVEYHTEVAQPTQIQKNLVQDLSKRAADIHAGLVKPDVDNMLKITSDGRKLGLDQRLINPAFPDEPGTKVNQCVGNILKIWKDGEADKLTQLVFCDISTPQPAAKRKKTISTNLDDPMIHALETAIPLEEKRPFTVYDDIRSKLIANGVPAEQIAFIHDANTDVKKKELFGKVRSGQVRVLLGSTSKMGAGTNCQDRLIAIHDLDCPWRPGDLEQRKGRIVRQGNRNKKVHVFRYVTEDTFDAYLWQTVENKQKFISQIMSSKSPVRACDDVDETALSFAEIKALCAGDPRIKERMDLEVDVSRLKIMKADHQSNQYRLEDNLLRRYPEQETKLKAYIEAMKEDMQTLAAHPHPKDGFAGMTVMTDELVEKDNAGAALIEAAKKATGLDPVTVGTYRGFKMSVTLEDFGKKYVLTMQGKATHQTELGSDPRGNLLRLDNALALMPKRLQALQTRLEEVYQQCEAAKAELGKPFPFEEELRDKTARMILLDAELNLDAKGGGQTEKIVAKSDRPSILNKLKNTPARATPGKLQKHHEEVR